MLYDFLFTALGGGYKKDGNRTGSVQRWGVSHCSKYRVQTFYVAFTSTGKGNTS